MIFLFLTRQLGCVILVLLFGSLPSCWKRLFNGFQDTNGLSGIPCGFDGGFDNENTDDFFIEAATTVLTPLLGVLATTVAEEDTVFSSTITRRLAALHTLLLIALFFLDGVSKPTSLIALGTEMSLSEAATICTASLSFDSLDNVATLFDMLVDVCNRWDPLEWILLSVFPLRTVPVSKMTQIKTILSCPKWL